VRDNYIHWYRTRDQKKLEITGLVDGFQRCWWMYHLQSRIEVRYRNTKRNAVEDHNLN